MYKISSLNQSVYILSADAKDLYLANHYLNPSKYGYNIRGSQGNISTKKLTNTFDYSLDLIKLEEVYQKTHRRNNFKFERDDKSYIQSVINVTFKYSCKEFNQTRKNIYIKDGYSITDIQLSDCVCVKDGELIAIKTGIEVTSPLSSDMLGKYFYFKNGKYHAKTNIKTIMGVSELRDYLYENGFYCDGVKYIRWKRSSGSSRVGKCLFIDEKLYKAMHKWEMCGIKIEETQMVDLAALESYISLTTSQIIDTMEIKPENILIVDDFESIFVDDVIATRVNNGWLESKPERVSIANSIWDGQSLMDISLFGKYRQYGMLLLRNRFFKSCCFNSNIQAFFSDNGITKMEQLKGYTEATDVKDIKLITTPSSIKYLKFGTLKEWLKRLEPTFGIVKHEKPTHFFDGRLVQTHYQLINTLQLSYEEVASFLSPSQEYILALKNDPSVLRYQIKYPENLDIDSSPLQTKNDITFRLLGINENFCNTKLYSELRDDLIKSYIGNIRRGHVLVNGNYSTILGNPLEMLKASIGKFDGTSEIQPGYVHSSRFKDGQTILGSRSPHVTMGNVLLAKNKIHPNISKYFNLTEEIICINSIAENILQRLSGSD